MVFIVGGLASGKKAYVMEQLGYLEDQIADGVLDERPVVYNLQNLLRTDDGPDLLTALLTKEIVVCNEVGSGIIPLDEKDRLWRETTGRFSIELARRADRVIRLVSGLPVILKEG